MASIYLLRHQRGGVLTKYAFLTTPSDEQMEAVGKDADAVFGKGWLSVYEVLLVEDGTVPQAEELGAEEVQGGATSGSSFPAIMGQGYGTVGVAGGERREP